MFAVKEYFLPKCSLNDISASSVSNKPTKKILNHTLIYDVAELKAVFAIAKILSCTMQAQVVISKDELHSKI